MRALFAVAVLCLAGLAVASGTESDPRPVDLTLAIRAKLFNKIFADAVPILNLFGASFPVPGVTEKHFKFDAFNLTHFHVGSASIDFSSPSTMSLNLNGVGLDIPPVDFEVMDTVIVPIKCKGQFWGNISSTTLDLAIDLVAVNGTLTVASVTPNVNFGSLAVNHTIDGSFCNDLQSIIRAFIGSLNKLIEKIVSKDLPSKLADIIEKEGNKAFGKLPFAVVGQPAIQNDTMALTLDVADRKKKKVHAEVRSTATTGAEKAHAAIRYGTDDVFLNRDLALGFSAHSINDLLFNEAADGKLAIVKELKYTTALWKHKMPSVYEACPDCPLFLTVDVAADVPPHASFRGESITLDITNGIIGLNAKSNSTTNPKSQKLVDTYLNFSISLVNFSVVQNGTTSILHFDLDLNDLALAKEFDILGNLIDFHKLGEILEDMMWAWIIPGLNKEFHGIPIHIGKDGVYLDNWKLGFGGDAFAIGFDLKIPEL